MKELNYKDYIIKSLGHDGFRIENPSLKISIAIDPFQIADEVPVDLILITHPHYDHCDDVSAHKLIKSNTKIIATGDCIAELNSLGEKVKPAYIGQEIIIGKIKIMPTPAYNTNKFKNSNEVFHPKEKGWLGYVIEIDNIRFYHAGDTDFIPEMKDLKKIDVAFLPISGTYVMDVEEAVQAAEEIQPKLAIPMHYGKILGSFVEAQRFSNLLKDKIPVSVLYNI